MLQVFLAVLNRSLAASLVIGMVLLARLLLGRAPKSVTCLLWLAVLIRLLCPFSLPFSSAVFPALPELNADQLNLALPEIPFETVADQQQNHWEATHTDPDGPQVWLSHTIPAALWLAVLWLLGVSFMLLCSLLSFRKLRKQLVGAVRLQGNIWMVDHIDSPFVLGLLHPRIYLPSDLSDSYQDLILLHETCHIHRLDHIWKLLAVLALGLHWFNPLVWIAFILSNRDLEMRCDEAVLRQLGEERRADYAAALLQFTTMPKTTLPTPAFGENAVKLRIRRLAHWTQPSRWISILTGGLCVLLTMFCLLRPGSTKPDQSFSNYENAVALAAEQETLTCIYYPPTEENIGLIQLGEVSGAALSLYLDSANWSNRQPYHGSLPSPGSVEFVITEDYRITIYEHPRIVRVRCGDEFRWYRSRRGDYTAALALVQSRVAEE